MSYWELDIRTTSLDQGAEQLTISSLCPPRGKELLDVFTPGKSNNPLRELVDCTYLAPDETPGGEQIRLALLNYYTGKYGLKVAAMCVTERSYTDLDLSNVIERRYLYTLEGSNNAPEERERYD